MSEMRFQTLNEEEPVSPESEKSANEAQLKRANIWSWIVNIFLLVAKVYISIVSNSKAVLSSLADSAVDLASQAILSLATRYMNVYHPDYPVGRSRLEALSVLASAGIMTMASIEIIQFSCVDLYNGFCGRTPSISIDMPMYYILGFGILTKAILFVYCRAVNKVVESDSLEALAEDHLNDVMSNTAAIVTVSIAFHSKGGWWVDPAGAIVISAIIIYRWSAMMWEQVKKVVGFTAPPVFISMVNEIAENHDSRLIVDCTRAYYFGARFNVEMEIILPGSMTVAESHDIALALQHKIEELDDVERAFVHVDHLTRDGLEHKVERLLYRSANTINPLANHRSATEDADISSQASHSTGLRSRVRNTSLGNLSEAVIPYASDSDL